MRACLALSILSDTRTAASTDSARSLKSTFETGHSALSGSAVAEPIVTPPPTSTRNAAAAATGTRCRARAERVGLAAGMPDRTAATAVSRSMSSGIGSAMTSARQDDSSATTWSSAWYARTTARHAETRGQRVDQLVVGLDRDEVDRLVQRGAVEEGAVAVTVVVVRHSDHLLLWHRLA